MLTTVRVQEKGQVTIPGEIRKKLKLKKGDLVTFLVKENGVVIQSVDAARRELFSELERSLQARGFTLEALLDACQKFGADRAGREFGLSEEERAALLMALQLQAQQALEEIRSQAEIAGLSQLSDEQIEAEIRATRNESPFTR